MDKKVIVAGHICIDITPVFPSEKAGNLSELLIPGKLINMKEASVHTGGAVANAGLAMKKFGVDAMLMGKVGNDAFGGMVQNILKEADAAEGLIVSDQVSTSYSIVLAVPGIDRIFLHNPGANDEFTSEDVSLEALKQSSLFHFGYPPIMKSMFVNQGDELVKLFKKAKEAGTMTSLDLAAVDPDSEAGKADWKTILTRVLPFVDVFEPSIEELCFMLDRSLFEELNQRAEGRDITEVLDIDKDVRPLANTCMRLGVKTLLIKCGARGIYYKTADTSIWTEKEGFEPSYMPEKVLSATGAGDTSIAAFLTAMLEGYTLEECLQLATATGASCVEAYDALSGIKSFDELKQKITNGWKKANTREWIGDKKC